MSDEHIQGVAKPTTTNTAEGLPPTPSDVRASFQAPMVRLTIKDVFLAWEKLRLIFNALLGVAALFLMFNSEFTFHLFAFLLLAALVFLANLCFCTCPVAELFLCWLGLPRQPSRWFVFCVGGILSVFLAMLALDKFLRGLGMGPL